IVMSAIFTPYEETCLDAIFSAMVDHSRLLHAHCTKPYYPYYATRRNKFFWSILLHREHGAHTS
ncbi:MAG: hypothetical protein ABL970_01870, partial [Nitrospira sp.]